MTDDSRGRGTLIRRILLAAAGTLLAAGAVVLAGAGFTLAAGRIAIRVHTPWRLLGPGALAAAAALAFGGSHAVKADLERAWAARATWARWVAGSAAVATLVAGLVLGTWTAGSADAYGYVSQALLWLDGSTVEIQPLAASPVFLFQLVQPMSDVPVTAWGRGGGRCPGAARLRVVQPGLRRAGRRALPS